MRSITYPFLKKAGRILNSGQARTLCLTGNIHDLFHLDTGEVQNYVPLVDFICPQWSLPGHIVLVYELNGPIRFVRESDREKLENAWLRWQTGMDANELAIEDMLTSGKARAEAATLQRSFSDNLCSAVGRPTVALEILRQLCLCSRSMVAEKPCLEESLIIFVEATDMLMPVGEISRLNDADRHRICICADWFSDPGFINGSDSVILLAESASLLNDRITRLPHVLEIGVPHPDADSREHFIEWFEGKLPDGVSLAAWGSRSDLAQATAGLSIHALSQLLKAARYENRALTLDDVIHKVETFIQRQLGPDVVEFKKPTHTLDDVVGFACLKAFLREEFMPRIRSRGPDAISGAAVCGPIGVGKTFIFEAMASELDQVVLILKNIRSQWFGQTDVLLERLRRVMVAFDKVLVFVDEADTQFGGVGPGAHSTERRLTGKIQAMMSDPQLRGRVTWLLMTARIHLLSPDIRRPGRAGDLIIPVLDPEGDDRADFIRWAVQPVLGEEVSPGELEGLKEVLGGFSAAGFASLRSELQAQARRQNGEKCERFEELLAVVRDILPPPIGETRRYQTLQALVNCTRRRLLPDPDVGDAERESWQREIQSLEARGMK